MTPRIIDIQRATCEYYGITLEDMLSQRRSYHISHPRQLAMTLCAKLTRHGVAGIGRMFGQRDHTTVMHALGAVATRMARDPAVKLAHDSITQTVMASLSPEAPELYADLIRRLEEQARAEVDCGGYCADILREAAAALKAAQRDLILVTG